MTHNFSFDVHMGEEQRPMIRMWTQGKAQWAAWLSAALLSLRTLCLLALLMMGAVSAARAQEASNIEVVPEPELLCMTPGARERSDVPYPADELRMRETGDVRVVLTFHEPDAPPKVKLKVGVDENAPSRAFITAVQDHVAKFRVPCLKPGGQPFVTTFRFAFFPAGAASPLNRKAAETVAESCLVQDTAMPLYPPQAAKRQLQGVVYSAVRFTAPDLPPEVTLLNHEQIRPFASTVKEYLAGWRMPCLAPGEIKNIRTISQFQLEGAPRARLNDMDLVGFLGMVKDIDKQSYKVDFAQIGCPFDLTFTLHQPYLGNRVVVHKRMGEEFLDLRSLIGFTSWLSTLELNLSNLERAQIQGKESIIHVPCIKLDI